MGYIKIWVHLVWTTKNRKPLLVSDIRKRVFDHIRENAMDKGIYIDYINGYLEEECHKKKSFQEEYDDFMHKYGFDKFVSG